MATTEQMQEVCQSTIAALYHYFSALHTYIYKIWADPSSCYHTKISPAKELFLHKKTTQGGIL